MASRLALRLLKWYAVNGRRLPWRGMKDAYRIWVSEVMLQQTRVETVIPYYRRWLKRFPTVKALAAASERDVLRLWEGLGYYARARNLHRAAKQIARDHRGQLPSTARELRRLPGIGPYTAGALASIAFGRDEVVLDGNVQRVLSRVFAVRHPPDSSAGRLALGRIATEHLPPGRAGDFNQAIMDLGATICVPFRPRCTVCPVVRMCRAAALGAQDRLPVRLPRGRIPHRELSAVVVKYKGRLLIARRLSKGLLGGMWEFPNAGLAARSAESLKGSLPSELTRAVESSYGLSLRRGSPLGTIQHAYSHYRVTVHVYGCESRSRVQGAALRWVRPADLRQFPMGRVDRQIADMITG
jgi:A/G-specific adenine glycosylase